MKYYYCPRSADGHGYLEHYLSRKDNANYAHAVINKTDSDGSPDWFVSKRTPFDDEKKRFIKEITKQEYIEATFLVIL